MFEKSVARRQHQRRQVVLGLGVIAGLIQQAYAQEAPAPAADAAVVTVTGYRATPRGLEVRAA